jgi:hypothetical protein
MEVANRKIKLGVSKASAGESLERRFVCHDCIYVLLGLEPKRIKASLSDIQ